MDSTPPIVADPPTRSEARRFVGALVITIATALLAGMTLRMPTQITANDISRYCTVWALLERGTYAIDDCPWQKDTQDKVRKPEPGSTANPPPLHTYSSKPPLLATLMAGVLYPARKLAGVPLDAVAEQPRVPRNVEIPDPDRPGQTKFTSETPAPARWPAYVLYFKPLILLFNLVPQLVFLVLYARLLDRYAENDWAWFAAIIAGAFGTLLFNFDASLNNHSVAASSMFFALYALIGILDAADGATRAGRFAAAGFFGGFAACNEIPAALFGLLLAVMVAARSLRLAGAVFVPAALVPLVAFFATQYLAFGQFRPVYEEFGTKSYNYEGSYWLTPLEFDHFNRFPESKPVYLFHMTFGHHGIFSLTPIFLFSLYAMVMNTFARDRPLRGVSALTLVLTVALLGFYTWNPKARNYGGTTSGLRWLFWLIPAWLVVLPTGLAGGQTRRRVRGLFLACLAVSGLSVGYAFRNPWSNPWLVDLLEHLNLYTLVR